MNRTAAAIAVATLVATAAIPAGAQGVGPGSGPGRALPPAAQLPAAALPLDQAITRARQYVGAVGNANLAPVEIIEFQTVYYVVVADRTTNKGAFAFLVDRATGNVSWEMGPPRMWNTSYGRTVGPGFGARAMGRRGPGMPGLQPGHGMRAVPWASGPGGARSAAASPLDEPRAREVLRAWVAQAFPGASVGRVVEYPGFFTYRLDRDGKTFGLASVHATTGRVWYAWHYGSFVRDQAIR